MFTNLSYITNHMFKNQSNIQTNNKVLNKNLHPTIVSCAFFFILTYLDEKKTNLHHMFKKQINIQTNNKALNKNLHLTIVSCINVGLPSTIDILHISRMNRLVWL